MANFRWRSIVLNRAVVILRYRQPFVNWINQADPYPKGTINLSDANEDTTAYLVEVEDEDEFESWLALNGQTLFEAELDGWYTDPSLWPADRSVARLKEWCTFELHTLVFDTGGAPLYDDDIEDGDG
jgi:hypothetical protein